MLPPISLLLTGLALTLAAASAGTTPPPTLAQAQPEPESASTLPLGITGEFSGSYDSRYVFRGATLAKNYAWGQVELDLPLSEQLTFQFTPYYGGSTDGKYRELDIIGMFAYEGDGYTLGGGFLWYHYLKGYPLDNQYEINLVATKQVGPIEIGLLYGYEFEVEGHYAELSASYQREITEMFGVSLSTTVASNRNYNTLGNSVDHACFLTGLPIKLGKSATLQPYAALNWAFADLRDSGEKKYTLYGGVQFSYNF
jgi:hypothetical protein